MEPDWSDFKILIALGDAGSVAGAARLLGVDSSTVSRRLAALEEAVGASLIIRGGREFVVTADGRRLLTAARDMAEASTKAVAAVRAARQDIAGIVRVSCISSLTSMLSAVLPMARDRFPALDIAIDSANRTVDLAGGEADIAIRHHRPTEPDLVLRPTADWGWGIYCSASYAEKYGLPASPQELKHHRLVLYIEAMTHLPGPAWLESHAAGAGSTVRVDSTGIARQVISSGAGIGVTTCYLGDDEPELARVFPNPVAYSNCFIVFHESLRSTARIRAVADLLAEFLKSKEAVLTGRR